MRASLLLVLGSCVVVLACSGAAGGDPGWQGGGGGSGDNGSTAGSGGDNNSGGGGGSAQGGAGGSGNTGGSGGSGNTGGSGGSGNAGGSGGSGGSGNAGGAGGSGGADAGTDSAPNDGFDQFQHHNLDVINQYRATLNIAPLVLDQQLSAFALAGSQELSQDHQPHQHFINASNDGSIWSSGFNSQAAENQGDPNGWYVMASDPTTNELDQIDSIQAAMFAEGPGTGEAHGHYTNMMNAQLTRLGVGLLEVNGQLYLTNDFSN
jgi:Cysteine-rich secretory protein family